MSNFNSSFDENLSSSTDQHQQQPTAQPQEHQDQQQQQQQPDVAPQVGPPQPQIGQPDFLAPLPIPNPPTATAQTSSSPPKTLWMGDLDPWSDEDAIANLWSSLGKRVLVKLIRAKKGTPAATLNTGHAGYCFIEFETYDDAKSALSLNGSQIPNTNRLFRLNWASGATLSSPIPQSPEFSLFVGDLSPSTTEAHLLALFQTHFKSVKTVRVMTDPITGTSRCFGFVRFSDEEERRRALTEMQGVWCAGRPLRVALATPRNQANSQNGANSLITGMNGLNLGGAGQFPPPQQQGPPGQFNQFPSPLQDQQQQLQQQIPGQGQLGSNQQQQQPPLNSNDMLMYQYQQGPPPPLQFYHPDQAPSANSQSVPYTDPNNTTVFIGGLASGIPEQTLAALFQPFGNITHVKIPPGKGCGFIRFDKREDAEAAIAGMQGFQIGGSRVRLSWGRAQNQQQRVQLAMAAAANNAAVAGIPPPPPPGAVGPAPGLAPAGLAPPPPPQQTQGIPTGLPTGSIPTNGFSTHQPLIAPVNSLYYLPTGKGFDQYQQQGGYMMDSGYIPEAQPIPQEYTGNHHHNGGDSQDGGAGIDGEGERNQTPSSQHQQQDGSHDGKHDGVDVDGGDQISSDGSKLQEMYRAAVAGKLDSLN